LRGLSGGNELENIRGEISAATFLLISGFVGGS
jgi:hypothetical protein